MTSMGRNTPRALLACFRDLAAFHWRYVITLQNYDLPLRTLSEMVDALRLQVS